jgi:ribosomal-protein-alanine N-acetyltransferase
MKISKAIKKDVKKLFSLENEVFKGDSMAISLSSFYYHLKNNTIFIVEENQSIIGYILWLERKNYFRLYSLCISTSFQENGLGKKLLEYSFEKMPKKAMQLEVRLSNQKAINLYEKFQFKKVKILKDFYENEDGVLMRIER